MMCEKCDALYELYHRTPQTIRDYYVMTNLFMMLHKDIDVCSFDPKKLGEKFKS